MADTNTADQDIYLLLVKDRHIDPEITPYRDEWTAVEAAKKIARDYVHPEDEIDEELNEDMRRDGWVYYATYSGEGDYVRVTKRSLR